MSILTDKEIEQAVKTGGVSWTGYAEDERGFYTVPILSPYHYQFAKAIEAAVVVKLAGGQNALKDEIRLVWQPKCDALRQQLEAAQAEVKHLNLHLKATQSGRDAALARLSKIERQEPVAEMILVDMGIGDARQLRVNWLMDGYLDVGAKLYAAAGASPVEPSESVEHRDELAKRKPEPAAETVGGLAEAVKAARGGGAPPAPMRRFA